MNYWILGPFYQMQLERICIWRFLLNFFTFLSYTNTPKITHFTPSRPIHWGHFDKCHSVCLHCLDGNPTVFIMLKSQKNGHSSSLSSDCWCFLTLNQTLNLIFLLLQTSTSYSLKMDGTLDLQLPCLGPAYIYSPCLHVYIALFRTHITHISTDFIKRWKNKQ